MTPGGLPATRRYRSVLWVPLLLVFLSGCSWFPWFGGDDEPEEIKPNPLPEINEEVSIRTAWSRRIGDGAGDRAAAAADFAAAQAEAGAEDARVGELGHPLGDGVDSDGNGVVDHGVEGGVTDRLAAGRRQPGCDGRGHLHDCAG